MRVFFFFLLLITGLAKAQAPVENLLFHVPENYKSASKVQKENVRGEEFLPISESIATWTEMLTVQAFRNVDVSVKEFRLRMEGSFKRSCKESASASVSEASEFGYDTAVWMQTCEYANKLPKDEIVVFKAIRGKEALYVIQKAFRYEPAVDKLTPWVDYMRKIRLCSVDTNDAACEPFKKNPAIKEATTVTPIFGELFVMKFLPQFREQGTQTRGSSFLRSMLLNTDDNLRWTQRVLLTANKLEAKDDSQTPRDKVMAIAASFNQACPTTFFAKPLSSLRIASGHDAYLALVSCGSHTMTNSKLATSETTLVLAIKGKLNFYFVQWSERGAPSEITLNPNLELWQQRMRSLAPFGICTEVPGEGAPYPSCFNTLEGK